jgi:hypothetical protein
VDTHSALQNQPGEQGAMRQQQQRWAPGRRRQDEIDVDKVQPQHHLLELRRPLDVKSAGSSVASAHMPRRTEHTQTATLPEAWVPRVVDSVSRDDVVCSGTHRPFMLVMICAKATATLSL